MPRVVVPIPFSDYVHSGLGSGFSLAGLRVSLSREFESAVERPSVRVREVARAFGLGLERKRIPVYSGFELELEAGDVVYVTGESGGGKSLLLRFLAERLSRESSFSPVVASWDVEKRASARKPLIDTLGRDTAEAIEILSAAGLTDTYTWLRSYNELSEGQRYRYVFALALGSGARTVILDEFCSTLDRETAKATAYTVQRYARRRGITLIVGTALNDLTQDLNPDIVVTKHLGPYVRVERMKPEPRPCSLLEKMEIGEGSSEDWRLLSFLHYRSQSIGGASKIYKASVDGRVVGVVVYSTPYFPAPGYSECFNPEWYLRERFGNVLRVSRVVVHPSFRGIGLSKKLLQESMRTLDKPFVEIVSTMQLYHNFTKSYMITVKKVSNERKRKALERMALETGIDPEKPVAEVARMLKTGGAVKRLAKWIEENYHIFLEKRRDAKVRLRDKQQVLTALMRIKASAAPKLYAVWINPDEKHRDLQRRALRREFIEKHGLRLF